MAQESGVYPKRVMAEIQVHEINSQFSRLYVKGSSLPSGFFYKNYLTGNFNLTEPIDSMLSAIKAVGLSADPSQVVKIVKL